MTPRRLHRFAVRVACLLWVAVCASARPASAGGPTMSECLSANESAIKLRAEHKLRQSREPSLVCTAPSCPRAVREACQKRAAQVESAIPTVVFEVKDASGNNLAGVAVAMDGELLATHLYGTAIAVDPGEHTFSFTASGQPSVEKHFILNEGVVDRHESIVLAVPLPTSTQPAPTSLSTPGLGTRRLVGLGLGGVGVAGVAVGSIFGVMTYSSWSSAGSACGSGGTTQCSRANSGTVSSDHNTAVTDGTISTVSFIAGGALLAAGIVIFLTGEHHEGERRPTVAVLPTISAGQAGLALGGAF